MEGLRVARRPRQREQEQIPRAARLTCIALTTGARPLFQSGR
ncbi:hypothetical protein LC55x_3652 [Lysobacter capsici]|nr:hypothetical protein LC55x_3652 [Lysobacter capsici]